MRDIVFYFPLICAEVFLRLILRPSAGNCILLSRLCKLQFYLCLFFFNFVCHKAYLGFVVQKCSLFYCTKCLIKHTIFRRTKKSFKLNCCFSAIIKQYLGEIAVWHRFVYTINNTIFILQKKHPCRLATYRGVFILSCIRLFK